MLVLDNRNYFSLLDSQGRKESFLVDSDLLTELLDNFAKLPNLFNFSPVLNFRHRYVSVITLSDL